LLGGVLALAGCAGHLEAVQITGDVGARLSSQETALGSLSATCLEVATLSDRTKTARSFVSGLEAGAGPSRSSTPTREVSARPQRITARDRVWLP